MMRLDTIQDDTGSFLALLGRVTGGLAAFLLIAGAILLLRTAYVMYTSKKDQRHMDALPERLRNLESTVERVKVFLVPLAAVMIYSSIKIIIFLVQDKTFSAWIGLFAFSKAILM